MAASKAGTLLLTVLLGGCDKDVAPGFDYELSGGAQVGSDETPTSLDHRGVAYDHPAAGYLVLDDSPIEPWCGAVLVAPDVALTSAACVDGRGASRLAAGFAVPNAGVELEVESSVVLEADPRLAAVVLGSPIDDIEPVSAGSLAARNRCNVASVSYRYVYGDDISERWIWSGCFERETAAVVPDDGGPNCHGDNGAPAFSADGELLGIVVASTGGTPCIDSVVLGVPGDSGAMEEALDLSDAV